jgi:hypothetical protein
LSELDAAAWEALCCHCGVCCLNKIRDISTGAICTTCVICEFYDLVSGQCSVYKNRFEVNPRCTKITPANIGELSWLPNCCNYRRACENRPLLKSPQGGAPAGKRLEDILGCEVVVYREGIDLAEYIVFCQYG